jgi:hypothetical protein
MIKRLLITSLCLSTPAYAEVFEFNSPAFSGNGYSTHVLTIHQLEQQRKDKIIATSTNFKTTLNQEYTHSSRVR